MGKFVSKLLEATGGFEPPNRGFADPRLKPLGYVALLLMYGAEEETRTPTALRPQRPQRCVSTNSTTSANCFWHQLKAALKDNDTQLKNNPH